MNIFNSDFSLTPSVSSIYTEGSRVIIANTTFIKDMNVESSGISNIQGGILYASDVKNLEITDSHFEGMDIATEGGAIYLARLTSNLRFSGGFIQIIIRN